MLSYALEQAEKPKNRDYSCKRCAPFKSAPTVYLGLILQAVLVLRLFDLIN